MNKHIGMIGLGNLGLPIAANLLASGYALKVYNRTPGKAAALVTQGAQLAAQAADVITPGGVVVSVLWDAAAVESVVTRAGFLQKLGPGGVHIAMSTVAPAEAERLAALHAEHGVTYIEAPVFGRPEAAIARKLWICMAGPQRAKAEVRPLLDAMGAQGVYDFGEQPGAATTVKLLGNFLMISAARSMHEAMNMAKKSGIDAVAAANMLTQTLLTAPAYQNYARMLAEKNITFSQPDIPLKDLGLFEATAQANGADTPIAHLLRDMLSHTTP